MQPNQNIQNTQNVQNLQSVQNTQAIPAIHNGQVNSREHSGIKPEKKFRAGALSIAVWKNSTLKDGKVVEYKTISFARSYKKNGTWQNTSASLRTHDLPKLAVMLSEAYKYLVMQTSQEQERGEEPLVM